MTTYGQQITWRDPISTVTVEVSGYSSPDAAFAAALDDAKAAGWTPPKWWQWWRWTESLRRDPTLDEK